VATGKRGGTGGTEDKSSPGLGNGLFSPMKMKEGDGDEDARTGAGRASRRLSEKDRQLKVRLEEYRKQND